MTSIDTLIRAYRDAVDAHREASIAAALRCAGLRSQEAAIAAALHGGGRNRDLSLDVIGRYLSQGLGALLEDAEKAARHEAACLGAAVKARQALLDGMPVLAEWIVP